MSGRYGYLAAGAVALASLTVAMPASAAFPGLDGRIAFVRIAGGRSDVYSVRPTGDGKRLLARNAREPAYSASARKIAFVRNGDVWKMRADGSHESRLTDTAAEDGNPAFSPSGEQIVFDSSARGGHLYLIRATGSERRRIGHTRGAEEPEFSPSGRRIIFQDGCRIVVADTTGAGERILTAPGGTVCDSSPDYAPQGGRVVFQRSYEDQVVADEIYVMRASGADPKRVDGSTAFDDLPAFSPNRGTRIAFDSDRDRSLGFDEIYVMRSDGSGVKRLTHSGEAVAEDPTWGKRR
jgi:Tol biopolymer transport system component